MEGRCYIRRRFIAFTDLPDEALDAIVERVVKRMSEGVIREVAWEVIPELSEIIIRQCLQEKGKT